MKKKLICILAVLCVLFSVSATQVNEQTAHVHSYNEQNPKLRVVLPTCKEKGYAYAICEECGAEKVLEEYPIDSNAHEWVFSKVIKEPTCTEKGVYQYKCSICSKTEQRYVASYGTAHNFKDVFSYDENYHWQECSICHTIIGKSSHTLTSKVMTVSPGCLTTGEYEQYCQICGATITTTISAKGHKFNLSSWDYNAAYHYHQCLNCDMTTIKQAHTYVRKVIEPTCTTNGEIRNVCSVCNAYYKIEDIEPTHKIVHHEAKAPTCTTVGWNAYDTCSRCDYSTYEEIPALGHELVHHEGKAATCAEVGWEAYDTCANCDYTTYKEIPKLAHTYSNVVDSQYLKSEATCTQPAVYYKSCSVCGQKAEAGSYSVNLNNQWRLSTSVENPNSSLYDGVYESNSNYNVSSSSSTMKITIEGYKEFSIYVRSNAESTYDYLKVYELDSDSIVKVSTSGKQNSGTSVSSYTKVTFSNISEGSHTITISFKKDNSGNKGSDRGYVFIPKNQPGEFVFESGEPEHELVHHEGKAATCAEVGWEAYDTCSNCDYTTYKEIPKLAHTYEEKAEERYLRTSATCLNPATYYKHCTVCDEHETYYFEYGTTLEHELVHHEGKAATCSEVGWEAYDTCANCDYTTYKEIPKLPHTVSEQAEERYLKENATCTQPAVYYKSCSVCGEKCSGNYSVNLNGQWRLSTSIANPDSTKNDGVYESYSNYNKGDSSAKMIIEIEGYTEFTFYVRSNAEDPYDYVKVYALDSADSVYKTTSGKQNAETNLADYLDVTYSNIPTGKHTIIVEYVKDDSNNRGTDRGYVIIPKEQEKSSTFQYGNPNGHDYENHVCKVCHLPENTLDSSFTVNSNGSKVSFSNGNLWYNSTTKEFHFENSQLSYQTAWNAEHVDKFYWSSKKSVAVAQNYSDPNRSSNDVFFAANNFTVDGYSNWSTLSGDEWKYLLFTRKTNVLGVGITNARFARVKIDGTKCLIIFPDDFAWTTEMGSVPKLINDSSTNVGENWSSAQSYTINQAEKMERAGMVILPAGGYRIGSSYYNSSYYGYYWTSSSHYYYFSDAGSEIFDNDRVSIYSGSYRSYALSIRLVTRVQN